MCEKVYDWTKYKKCPVCGKLFFPAPHHVYKDERDYNRRLVCGFSCMMTARRINEERRSKRKADAESNIEGRHEKWTPEEDAIASELRAAGKTYNDIAGEIGRTEKQVRGRFAYLKYKAARKREAEQNRGDADGRA